MHLVVSCSIVFLLSAAAANCQEQALTQDTSFAQSLERVEDTLNSAFSGVGPVKTIITGVIRTTGAGWGISFAVIWRNVDPATSGQLAAEIRGYDGKLQWASDKEFNYRGVSVSAFPRGMWDTSVPSSPVVSEADLDQEVLDFAQYIRSRIAMTGIRTGGTPKTMNSADAYGISAYDVYLVRDPSAFSFDAQTSELLPTSEEDARLHIALLDNDLSALAAELHGSKTPPPMAVNEFISSLLGLYLRITVGLNDANGLDQSLDDLLQSLSDPRSRRAIERVRQILKEAIRERLAVVFEPTR